MKTTYYSPEETAANRKTWVDALLSGKYRQAMSHLKLKGSGGAQDEYCCMGVACEISGLGKWYPRNQVITAAGLLDHRPLWRWRRRDRVDMPSPGGEGLARAPDGFGRLFRWFPHGSKRHRRDLQGDR